MRAANTSSSASDRSAPRLVVLPALRVPLGPPVLTRKLRTGLEAYAERWPGEVHVGLEVSDALSDDLDHEQVDQAHAPFSIRLGSFAAPELLESLGHADIVLGALNMHQNHLAAHCRSRGVPFVPIAEYTLRTRRQIVHARPVGRARRWGGYAWEARQEIANRSALGLSAGVQCNGWPAYRAYRDLTPAPLLFFDGRVSRAQLATEAERKAREQRFLEQGPLHLVYFGRLVDMKGPLDLLEVARRLREMKIDFKITIVGGGPLAEQLRAGREARGLEDCVDLKAPMDFADELMPYLRASADVGIFCHPQGDPSCSYLEAMSAGLPIVGYANEALSSLVETAPVGWSAPLGRANKLAARIAALHADRSALVEASRAAFDFAADHTFERTMDQRVEHVMRLAGLPG